MIPTTHISFILASKMFPSYGITKPDVIPMPDWFEICNDYSRKFKRGRFGVGHDLSASLDDYVKTNRNRIRRDIALRCIG